MSKLMTNPDDWRELGQMLSEIDAKLPKGWIFAGLMARADIDQMDSEDPNRWTAIAMQFEDVPLGPMPEMHGRGVDPRAAVEELLFEVNRSLVQQV